MKNIDLLAPEITHTLTPDDWTNDKVTIELVATDPSPEDGYTPSGVASNHIAVKYYSDYHSGSAKTLKSIQITLAARLEKFNLQSLASLTATDELDLHLWEKRKWQSLHLFLITIVVLTFL